jgi:hypothetical protein
LHHACYPTVASREPAEHVDKLVAAGLVLTVGQLIEQGQVRRQRTSDRFLRRCDLLRGGRRVNQLADRVAGLPGRGQQVSPGLLSLLRDLRDGRVRLLEHGAQEPDRRGAMGEHPVVDGALREAGGGQLGG